MKLAFSASLIVLIFSLSFQAVAADIHTVIDYLSASKSRNYQKLLPNGEVRRYSRARLDQKDVEALNALLNQIDPVTLPEAYQNALESVGTLVNDAIRDYQNLKEFDLSLLATDVFKKALPLLTTAIELQRQLDCTAKLLEDKKQEESRRQAALEAEARLAKANELAQKRQRQVYLQQREKDLRREIKIKENTTERVEVKSTYKKAVYEEFGATKQTIEDVAYFFQTSGLPLFSRKVVRYQTMQRIDYEHRPLAKEKYQYLIDALMKVELELYRLERELR